jgi:competence protein ComEC
VWDGVVFQFLHPEAKLPSAMTLAPKPVTVRAAQSKASKNAQSCVLHIQGAYHSALLPGDIGVKEERLIMDLHFSEQHFRPQHFTHQHSTDPHSLGQPTSERFAAVEVNAAKPGLTTPRALTADLVVVAHHGSETSSSLRFVQQIGAQHAIAQTGYLNRFGHPHAAIQQRWLDAQVRFWQTDRHGAVMAESLPRGLIVQSYSQLRQRYWHRRSP